MSFATANMLTNMKLYRSSALALDAQNLLENATVPQLLTQVELSGTKYRSDYMRCYLVLDTFPI